MRRMYSEGQVVKVVNKAIEEGEIQAGGLPKIESGDAGKALVVNAGETGAEWATVGLSPEDQEKLDNSLQLPGSAPAAQQLVGINTSGEQNALGIGDGLNIDADGNISSDFPTIVLDFNNSTVINNLDEALYTKLTTAGSNYIIKVVNGGSSVSQKAAYSTYYRQSYSNPLIYENIVSNSTESFTENEFSIIYLKKTLITFSTISGGIHKAVLSDGTSLRSVSGVGINVLYNKIFSSLSGTDTGWKTGIPNTNMIAKTSIIYSDTANKVIVRLYITEINFNNASVNKIVYAEGHTTTNKYSLEWNTYTGVYTITVTAL